MQQVGINMQENNQQTESGLPPVLIIMSHTKYSLRIEKDNTISIVDLPSFIGSISQAKKAANSLGHHTTKWMRQGEDHLNTLY